MKRNKWLISILLSSACLVTSLTACTPKETYSTLQYTYEAFNTEAILQATECFDTKPEWKEKFADLNLQVANYLAQLNNSLSTEVKSSPIARFNSAEAGQTVVLDKTSYDALSLALEMYHKTDGHYNPAVYHSVDLYGFTARFSGNYEKEEAYDRDAALNPLTNTFQPETLPTEEYISAFQQLNQYFGEINLTQDSTGYYAEKPENAFVTVGEINYSMKIDLGGIGKGIAADTVDRMLDQAGFQYSYFSFGSSSIAVNEAQSKKNGNMQIDFRDPRELFSNYVRLNIKNTTISTSGDYERFYQYPDGNYCHIIDPATGKPIARGIMTSSVYGCSAAEGDAYSTALMTLKSTQEIATFINTKMKGLGVIVSIENQNGKHSIITNIADLEYNNGKYEIVNTIDEQGTIVI